MLHAKFHIHRTYGSREENFKGFYHIYRHGGHLGHVTWTIYLNFRSLFTRGPHMKFGFDWPSSSREDV